MHSPHARIRRALALLAVGGVVLVVAGPMLLHVLGMQIPDPLHRLLVIAVMAVLPLSLVAGFLVSAHEAWVLENNRRRIVLAQLAQPRPRVSPDLGRMFTGVVWLLISAPLVAIATVVLHHHKANLVAWAGVTFVMLPALLMQAVGIRRIGEWALQREAAKESRRRRQS